MSTAAEYFAALADLRRDAAGLAMVLSDHGATVADALDLRRFWDSLRPDLDAASHRRVTAAWLATCVIGSDASAERERLRAFIRWACAEKGWLRTDGRPAD